MPSRRHSAAIDSSPRRHSSTMRIFSSAEYCLRVARRMSLMTCSDGAFPVPDFCLIFAPLKGYDEPEILRSQLSRFGRPNRRILLDTSLIDDAISNHRSYSRRGLGIHNCALLDVGILNDVKLSSCRCLRAQNK